MRPVEREKLLEALPTSTLRYLAREFGLNGPTATTRPRLKSALAEAPSFSMEIMITLLRGEDLQRVGQAVGMPEGRCTRKQLKARLVGVRRRPGDGNSPQFTVPENRCFLLDMSPVGKIFRGFRGSAANRLYIGEAIPDFLLVQAAAQMRIPEYERIIVLYDNSLRGTCASGFAIGEHGIYWRNPFRIPSRRTALHWSEFAAARLESAGEFELRLGPEASMQMTFLDRDALLGLLEELQHYAQTEAHRRGMAVVCPDMHAVVARCKRFNPRSFESFYFGAKMSENFHDQALHYFNMPDYERVVALCDDTVLATGRRGFVIGMHGLYWRNSVGTPSERMAYSWCEFAAAKLKGEDDQRIWLGHDACIHLEFLQGNTGDWFFSELQSLVRAAAEGIARGTHLGKEESRVLRRELTRDLRDTEAMPVSVARANHVSLLGRAQAESVRLASEAVRGAFTLMGRTASGILRKAKIRR